MAALVPSMKYITNIKYTPDYVNIELVEYPWRCRCSRCGSEWMEFYFLLARRKFYVKCSCGEDHAFNPQFDISSDVSTIALYRNNYNIKAGDAIRHVGSKEIDGKRVQFLVWYCRKSKRVANIFYYLDSERLKFDDARCSGRDPLLDEKDFGFSA